MKRKGWLAAPDWQLIGIWLFVRLLTSLWAALVSPLRSLTAAEQTIALWPPSTPLAAWLERVLLSPWERWDVQYYVWIVTRGYRATDGTAQFHPLFAWLAVPLARLSGQPLLSLLIVASLASLLLLPAFERLARLDLDADAARVSTLLLTFSPVAFILFAPYTEGLFLLFAVACFLALRQQRWWLAGACGALATLTRQQGLLLILPMLWELGQTAQWNVRRAASAWRDWLAIGLIPLGMGIWLIYRAVILGDLQPNLASLHDLIYSVLISPSASKVVTVQTFLWPWQALGLALMQLWRKPADPDLLTNLIMGAGFIVLLVIAWQRLRPSYRLYAAAITLISFSYHTGPQHPYMGLPRHLLLAFPVLIGAAPALHKPWMRLTAIGAGLTGMLFLLLQYVLHSWIP